MKQKIKILYITNLFMKMGGSEKNIFDTIRSLDRNKYIPYVFALQGGEMVEKSNALGIYAKTIGLGKIFSLNAMRKGIRLFRFLRKEGIHIVITYHHDADIWGGLIARLARVPIIISNRRDLGFQLEKKHIWAYRILNNIIYDHIIAVSDAVKQKSAKEQWTRPSKITTVYNGIDLRSYSGEDDAISVKKELGIDETKAIVGMVASFRSIKGQIYFVEAAAEILKKCPRTQFIIVGFKDTEYYQEVRKLIQSLGISKHIICTGHRGDVPALISMFDIAVISSINEGFSNAILECMASGKPVVAPRCGGNPEIVVDGQTGLLVSPCNSDELAEAITSLLEDKKLRFLMGQRGQLRVQHSFSLDNMLSEITELYEYFLLLKKSKKIYFGEWMQAIKVNYVNRFFKIVLSYILYYSGIIRIYSRIFPTKTKILAYHSINTQPNSMQGMVQNVKNFEHQMRYLKDNFRVISLTDLCRLLKNGKGLPKNSVVITFDDGYRDNYLNAYPILRKYKLPATLFLTTHPVETQEPLFFDALCYGIFTTLQKIVNFQDLGLSKYLLDKKILQLKAIKEINNFSKQMTFQEKSRFLHILSDRLKVDFEELKAMRLYLSWDEVMEMSRDGIEIGAHTKTHTQLASMPDEELQSEILDSRDIIEKRLGEKVFSFAYPFGSTIDFDHRTKEVVKNAGFECACSLIRGSGSVDILALNRIVVDDNMTSTFSGGFCKPLFATELSGIFDKFRTVYCIKFGLYNV
jgi:glycosyltransferase involved in cell wall biosynthesis/peptidoglycan/xylan/chitin deacetylase (PgdA/CDA1 family)